MANPEFFLYEFMNHAVNGYIGDPNGEDSYGYIRVSSKGQAEEGRSGLPRQIEAIHIKAKEEHLRISWDMVFADDHTGFEFEDRPQLQKLLKEIINKNSKRANAVVFEKISRLSRNAEWHQGYLLENFKKHGVKPISSKNDVDNRLTRTILGVVAQEGMEDAKDQLVKGMKKKLESGRVTGKSVAYGYKLVDSNGNEGTKARKDSHYAINENEAEVVRYIFHRIAVDGIPLRALCDELNTLYKPPKRSKCWEKALVSIILKNEVYYGEYIGNRKQTKKVPVTDGDALMGRPTKKIYKTFYRPKEEWIHVSVPAIVSKDIWELANDVLKKNAVTSSRNGNEKYLLTGLIKCASCGHTYIGQKIIHVNNSVSYYYRCNTVSRPRAMRDMIGCTQFSIGAKSLEKTIWKHVCELLTEPQKLIEALERIYDNDGNNLTKSQIKYIKEQLEVCDLEDKRVRQGYNAGVYTAEEAKEERENIKAKKEKHQELLDKLQEKLLSAELFEKQKTQILAITESFKNEHLDEDTPFDEKRRIIKAVIGEIVLNTHSRTMEITGIINGLWAIDDHIEYTQSYSSLLNIEWKGHIYLDESDKTSIFIVSTNSGCLSPTALTI